MNMPLIKLKILVCCYLFTFHKKLGGQFDLIVRIAKTNTILKRPVNKFFAVENTYHDAKQTDKANHTEIASPFPCCPLNRE